jgi:hypothetical protein
MSAKGVAAMPVAVNVTNLRREISRIGLLLHRLWQLE